MVTREEVTGAIGRFRSTREAYEGTSRDCAEARRRRWDASREAPGDRRTDALAAANAVIADAGAVSDRAFEAMGRALVEMYSLARDARRDPGAQGPAQRGD